MRPFAENVGPIGNVIFLLGRCGGGILVIVAVVLCLGVAVVLLQFFGKVCAGRGGGDVGVAVVALGEVQLLGQDHGPQDAVRRCRGRHWKHKRRKREKY